MKKKIGKQTWKIGMLAFGDDVELLINGESASPMM